MQHVVARRTLVGLVAAGALIAGGATPALAAPPARITLTLRDVTVAPNGQTQFQPVWVADREVELAQPRMVYELDGQVAGLSLHPNPNGVEQCTTVSPTRLECRDWVRLGTGPDGVTGPFRALVKAAPTVADGATATVTATFTADGVDPVTATAQVRVAGGVDLAAGPDVELDARPGAAVDVPLVVRNAGRTVVEGAAVIFHAEPAFRPRETYRNCLYREGRLTACTFGEDMPVGASYRGVMPYRVADDAAAPGKAGLQLQWLTTAELRDYERYLEGSGRPSLGRPGTGEELRLREQSAVRQTDTNPRNNWSYVFLTVTGKQGADLVALGASVPGAAGDVVTTTVGVRNDGPASVDLGGSGDPAARTRVTVPDGTTVVEVPEECLHIVDGQVRWEEPVEPGHRAYLCMSDPSLPVGATATHRFRLRIDRVVAGARGAVVVNGPCDCPQFEGELDPADNTAALVVNGTGGDGSDGGTDGSGGSAGPDDDGDGGGLPVTGPAGIAVAGVGLALLVTGGTVFVVARRRRARFVA